ncbi:MAG: 8-amino-7-oxononanoate synthase [Myxococcota bacterium]
MALLDHVQSELRELEAAGLLRRPRHVEGPQGPRLRVDGRSVLCFCSNNYLGLAEHPALLHAAQTALDRHGLGSGASRLISGTMEPHRLAEQRLARFVGAEAALLFATGYAANTGTLAALAGPQDVIFSDALNHASLIDGCRLSRATVHVYPHGDTDHLEALLARHRPHARRAIIASDALFSMDGDRAPVVALRRLADRHDAALLVDEAHALGVVGPQGRGLCAAAGVVPDVLIGTLGKAFGVAGAFAAARTPIVQLLYNRARSFVFSTAPPPSTAAAVAESVELVATADDRRTRLADHAERLRTELTALGCRVPPGRGPIVPLLIGAADATMRLSAALFDRGFFVQGIRPPTVPRDTSRLRIVPIATHTDEDVSQLIDAIRTLLPSTGGSP